MLFPCYRGSPRGFRPCAMRCAAGSPASSWATWSEDMAAVLGELEWCCAFAQAGQGAGQMLLLQDLAEAA